LQHSTVVATEQSRAPISQMVVVEAVDPSSAGICVSLGAPRCPACSDVGVGMGLGLRLGVVSSLLAKAENERTLWPSPWSLSQSGWSLSTSWRPLAACWSRSWTRSSSRGFALTRRVGATTSTDLFCLCHGRLMVFWVCAKWWDGWVFLGAMPTMFVFNCDAAPRRDVLVRGGVRFANCGRSGWFKSRFCGGKVVGMSEH
jgi:hypothetical protein